MGCKAAVYLCELVRTTASASPFQCLDTKAKINGTVAFWLFRMFTTSSAEHDHDQRSWLFVSDSNVGKQTHPAFVQLLQTAAGR